MLLTKVCGMMNRENIQDLIPLNPDFIGYIFYSSSPRNVKPAAGHSLTEKVPSAIKKVGVFVNSSIEEIMDKLILLRLDYVQLSGNESLSFVRKLNHANIPIIKTVHLQEEKDLEKIYEFSPFISKFLFDTKSDFPGGSGLKFNWNILNAYHGDVPFFLSGGIGPQDIDAILSFSHPRFEGVDINSKFEIEPGIKNIELIRKFLSAIRKTNEL